MEISYVLLNAYGMGGTIRTVINQAEAMAARGHDVEIISVVRRRERPRFPITPAVRLRPLVDRRPHAVGGGLPTLIKGAIDGLPGREVPKGERRRSQFTRGVERALIECLRGIGGDVLVTTRPALNIIAARYAPRRVVRIAQDHMHLSRYDPRLREAIVAEYPKLDAVVTLTQRDLRDYMGALGGNVRLARIPNAAAPPDGTIPDRRRKIVVAAGRLTGQKGFDLLIRAFAGVAGRHPGWRLHIFGDGPMAPHLAEMIRHYGLDGHVLLKGRTRRLGPELAKASIYVLSSRFEGFPMVVLEALSHGLPVVGFDCPTGPSEIITDGTDGLIVPAEDVDGLTEAICRLIEDDRLRRAMASAAEAKAVQFNPEAIAATWEKLFSELITDKAADAHP